MPGLSIKSPDACQYDAASLGEVMLRLDPGYTPMARARHAAIYHGGGETNVGEGLAYCFGLRSIVLTALVDDGIGRSIENQMREAGVDTSKIVWFNTSGKGPHSTDQKGTLHNGISFTYVGKGVLPSVTEYYRAHTPVRELQVADIDWDDLFGRQGVRWFNTGGIFTLLSPSTPEVALAAMKAAKKHGTVTAFDLNYRSKVEPSKDRARGINKTIVPHVDFLVGNQDDFFDALGYETEETSVNATQAEWLKAYQGLLRQVAQDYPNLAYIGTQLRGPITADRINWGAVLYETATDTIYQAPIRENVEIIDRTGGGDSFASGVAAAFLDGKDAQTAVEWGAAHGILVQSLPGDTTMITKSDLLKEVKRARSGGGVSALR